MWYQQSLTLGLQEVKVKNDDLNLFTKLILFGIVKGSLTPLCALDENQY